MSDAVIVSAGPLARVDGLRGVVHAVFPSSLYIEPHVGPLVVVHELAHGHTPTSLLVACARPPDWGVAPGDAVAGGPGRLRVGSALLDARGARVWRPPPVRGGDAASASPFIADTIDDDALAADCRRLAAALAADDRVRTRACTAALIGRGPGLTPAGDDALAGLLAVLHRGGGAPARRCRESLAACVQPLLARTTPISAHYLRLALEGHFGEHLTHLVDGAAAPGGPRPELIARVRGIGATSGADALAGVRAGFELLAALATPEPAQEAA